MYKKQMILQRIVCFIVLIAAALVFVYSLGLLTDMYENKLGYHAEKYYTNGMTEEALSKVKVTGVEIYYDMQQFNRELTTAGLVLILMAVSQYVFQNQNRRKYYIANYITVGVNTIAVVGASVWALNNIFTYREMYLQVDFVKLAERAELMKFYWTDSTFWFDISKGVFGILLAATVLNVINLIFKIVVMNAEKKLIAEGKEV